MATLAAIAGSTTFVSFIRSGLLSDVSHDVEGLTICFIIFCFPVSVFVIYSIVFVLVWFTSNPMP
jgi:hypothetical protein